jgi:hypothetical protein
MIQAILVSLLDSSPFFIVWLVGIILAVVRWRKHPRLSLLLVIVFPLIIVCQSVIDIVDVLLPLLAYQEHLNFTTIGIVNLAVYVILFIPLWSLLLWAIFGWRSPATTATPVPLVQPPWAQAQQQPSFQSWQAQQAQFQAPQQYAQPGQPQLKVQQPQQPQSSPDSVPPQNQA